MFTTPAQCFDALKSNRVRAIGINNIHICYAGESALIRKDKTYSWTMDWKPIEDYTVIITDVFVDDGDLYIILNDIINDFTEFDGRLNNLAKVLSADVRSEWNIGVENGKWLYDNGNPIIKGVIISTNPNTLYVY